MLYWGNFEYVYFMMVLNVVKFFFCYLFFDLSVCYFMLCYDLKLCEIFNWFIVIIRKFDFENGVKLYKK